MLAAAPLLLLALAPTDHPPSFAPPPSPSVQAAPAVAARIDALERTIDEVRSRHLRAQLRRELRDLLLAIDQQIAHAPPVEVVVTPPPPPPLPAVVEPAPTAQGPLTDGEYRELRQGVAAERLSSEKLSYLQTFLSTACLTSNQGAGLLKLFAHSSDRMEAATAIVPRLTDRHNALRLRRALVFSSEKRQLDALINSGPVESRCWAP